MFSRKSNRNLTKGVRIDLEDNRVSVDVTITVDYGSPIPDVARNIQENVKKAIETMSGLDVKNVDVHVTGISFEREQRANAELDEQHRKMLEKNAEVEAMPKSEAEETSEAAEAADQPGVEAVTVEAEAAWDEDEEAPEGFEDKEGDCAADEAEDDGFADDDAAEEEGEDSDADEADI